MKDCVWNGEYCKLRVLQQAKEDKKKKKMGDNVNTKNERDDKRRGKW